MIRAMVTLTVKDQSNIDTVKQHLTEHSKLSREEPGCLRFEAYQSQQEPAVFYICEFWEDQAALDKHREAKGFTEIYTPKVVPLVERRLDLLDLVFIRVPDSAAPPETPAPPRSIPARRSTPAARP